MEAILRDPNFAALWPDLEGAYCPTGNPKKKIEEKLALAIHQQPDDFRHLVVRGFYLFSSGDFADAAEDLERALGSLQKNHPGKGALTSFKNAASALRSKNPKEAL